MLGCMTSRSRYQRESALERKKGSRVLRWIRASTEVMAIQIRRAAPVLRTSFEQISADQRTASVRADVPPELLASFRAEAAWQRLH